MSRVDEIRSSIEGSTVTDCMLVAAEWAAFKRAQEAWAACGQASAQKREREMRERIIAAAGAMGLIPSMRRWSPTVKRRIGVNLTKYGFETEPDIRTVRKAREYLLKNGTTQPSCPPPSALALYASSSTT